MKSIFNDYSSHCGSCIFWYPNECKCQDRINKDKIVNDYVHKHKSYHCSADTLGNCIYFVEIGK